MLDTVLTYRALTVWLDWPDAGEGVNHRWFQLTSAVDNTKPCFCARFSVGCEFQHGSSPMSALTDFTLLVSDY